MADKSFDDSIKSKLDDFQIELNSEHWDMFEEFQASYAFDQNILKELENHHLEALPQDWPELEQKIDATADKEVFDAHIESKLAGLFIAEKADWEDFEKIMDAEDANFDSEVSSKLKHHEISESETHWPKLSAHLQEFEKRRKRILYSKLAEVAIFLLLIISLLQFLPSSTFDSQQVFRTVSVQKQLAEKRNVLQVATIREIEPVSEEELSMFDIEEDFAIPESDDFHLIEFQAIQTSIRESVQLEPVQDLDLFEVNTPEKEIFAFNNEPDPSQIINEDDLFKSDVLTEYSLASLALLEPELAYQYNIPEIILDENREPLNGLWFTTYASPDVNFINTPYDPYYDVDAYRNLGLGYTIGAKLEYAKDNWAVAGGIAYSLFNYSPSQITEITGSLNKGYTLTTLNEIIFDIINLPFDFKYELYEIKGWSFYANTGISAGIVAFATYDVDEEFQAPLVSRAPGISTQTPSTVNPKILNRKEFDPGILNGGKLSNNLIGSIRAGVGVRKIISENIAFYIQPTYNHNIRVSGLGPNRDLHHRLNVEIGTKIRIN